MARTSKKRGGGGGGETRVKRGGGWKEAALGVGVPLGVAAAASLGMAMTLANGAKAVFGRGLAKKHTKGRGVGKTLKRVAAVAVPAAVAALAYKKQHQLKLIPEFYKGARREHIVANATNKEFGGPLVPQTSRPRAAYQAVRKSFGYGIGRRLKQVAIAAVPAALAALAFRNQNAIFRTVDDYQHLKKNTGSAIRAAKLSLGRNKRRFTLNPFKPFNRGIQTTRTIQKPIDLDLVNLDL